MTETLAKVGIVFTNITIVIGGLLFMSFMYGMLGVGGAILAVCMTVGMSTAWWMMASAYNKFMKSGV